MGKENKSVTIRLDEPDLCEWAASQSSATASIRTAIKICILQFGKHSDLLDAIISDRFGNGSGNGLLQLNPAKQETALQTNETQLPQTQSNVVHEPVDTISKMQQQMPSASQTSSIQTGFPDMGGMGQNSQDTASISSLL